MLDAIYNVKSMKESLQDKSLDEMFALLYSVSKYEIPKLLLVVKESISSFPITEDNVLVVATDAMEYLTTFEEAAQILLLACARFLKPKVSDNNGERMSAMQKLAVLMRDMPPSPISWSWCDECQRKRTECLDGELVTKDNVKIGIKVIRGASPMQKKMGAVVRKNDGLFSGKTMRKARVMVVGCRGAVNINPRQMMMSEATLQGVSLASSSPEDWKKMGAAIVAGIESGWVNPVVNRVYAMEEVQQVHYDIIHSKGAKGKLVLNVAKE